MEHESIRKQLIIYEYKPRGTRFIGSPKLRWKNRPVLGRGYISVRNAALGTRRLERLSEQLFTLAFFL
jgi:hypothetical protein